MSTIEISEELAEYLQKAGLKHGAFIDVTPDSDPTEEGAARDLVVAGILIWKLVTSVAPGLSNLVDTAHRVQLRSENKSRLELVYRSAGTIEKQGDGDEWCIELSGEEWMEAVVVDETRRGVVARRQGGKLELAPIELAATDNAAQVAAGPFESSVLSWCSYDLDPWLAEEVAKRIQKHDEWQAIVAVSIFVRHRTDSTTASDAQALVEQVLGGVTPSSSSEATEWLLNLDNARLRWMEDLAMAEIALLNERIGELEELLISEDDGWRDRLVRICHRRDDLAGLHSLAVRAGATASEVGQRHCLAGFIYRLEAALECLDECGRTLVQPVDAGTLVGDERLARIAVTDRVSWWTMLASSDEEGVDG